MNKGLIHFVHGKESGPAGAKIAALAAVAWQQGWDVASLDYTHTADPALRLEQLRKACSVLDRPLLLVGSSMGGWVAAEASAWLDAHGVFLLAPAVYMPDYPTQAPALLATHAEIVHGWDDDLIPCEHAIRYARLRGCTLHLVQGDHRLNHRIPLLRELFGAFLSRCSASA
ncbi:YqiA/YcfP family alpha/beta fold hydrolase [Massilia litorea]|jgi:surfactin synthase thioesterase subunit|uniref:Alpha/beta fold hydrolase n=1 Tax=Massilia litorea TaxID=2769491 RepID=A0A7L9U0E4_9BURK|nr:YqiA/YcfP family alpha/beta fold hydrolase [Massilia litorea]QOL48501.1 alpha/beta fold hydrolase [Massilia litorea]